MLQHLALLYNTNIIYIHDCQGTKYMVMVTDDVVRVGQQLCKEDMFVDQETSGY